MNTESLRLLEQYLAGEFSPDEARFAEQVLSRGDAEAGRGEALAVYTFLTQMGPLRPPAELVARTCERLRAEASCTTAKDPMPRTRSGIGTALSWSYRGPALVVAGPWRENAAHYAVQGLAMSRFALGPLGLAPRGLASRSLSSLGLSRPSQPRPRASGVWRRLLGVVRSP